MENNLPLVRRSNYCRSCILNGNFNAAVFDLVGMRFYHDGCFYDVGKSDFGNINKNFSDEEFVSAVYRCRVCGADLDFFTSRLWQDLFVQGKRMPKEFSPRK